MSLLIQINLKVTFISRMKVITVMHMRHNKHMGERGRAALTGNGWQNQKIWWVKTNNETKPKKLHWKTGKCGFVSWGGITRKDLKTDCFSSCIILGYKNCLSTLKLSIEMESGWLADLIIWSGKKPQTNKKTPKKQKTEEKMRNSGKNLWIPQFKKGKSKDFLNNWRKSKEVQK